MASTIRPGGTMFYFIPYVPTQGPGTRVSFPAYIDDFSSDHNATWETSKEMGRPDPKFRYSEWSRSISVSFKTVATSNAVSTKRVRDLLNTLVTMSEPIYKSGKGYNGIFVRMTVGQIFDDIGVLENVNVAPAGDTPWIDDIPVVHDVSLSFNVVGKKKPEYRGPNKPFGGQYGSSNFA